MTITFPVSPVARATEPLRIPTDIARVVQSRPVEALGASITPFLPAAEHALLRAAHTAFALHYPLALSPDTIWLAIAQGFAQHVNVEAERLRGKFVRHPAPAVLEVRRDDFVKGAPTNPWPEAFGAFSDTIAEHIGRQRDLVVCDFSTTGPCERAASEIVLLDAMKRYFRYELHSKCGIPEITLDGTVDDWRSIRRRARALEEYELGWWTAGLEPVLDQLVATAEGRVDAAFWQKFFKHADGSGGPWVRGWINVLFPYVKDEHTGAWRRNELVSGWVSGLDAEFGGGPTPASIPSGLACAPFDWHYLGTVFPMEFLGGFVGVAQDAATLTLRPAIGWAVCDATVERSPEPAPEAPLDDPRAKEILHLGRAALIAGRASPACSLCLDEILELRERVARAAEASDLPIAFAVAADLGDAYLFPEAPARCRLVVGVGVRSVGPYEEAMFTSTDIRRALESARAIPDSLWRELADFGVLVELGGPAGAGALGGLSAEVDLHLAIAGGDRACDLSADSHGGGAASTIAEVTTTSRPYVTLDPALADGERSYRIAVDDVCEAEEAGDEQP